MASKKEIKEYVKIQLEKMKKGKTDRPDAKVYINKYTEDEFIVAIFENILRRDYKNSFAYTSVHIEDSIEKVAPTYVKQAVADMNYERYLIYIKDKAIEKYNDSIDNKYKDFCTELLLVGNGQLADFAKSFIESLKEAK